MAKTPTAAKEKPATKTASTKTPAKTGAAKDKSAAPKTGGIFAPIQPSADLGAIVGNDKLPRSEVISKVWAYIKQHDLQNPENKREIVADEKLKKIFGKDKVTMFEMNKHLAGHMTA